MNNSIILTRGYFRTPEITAEDVGKIKGAKNIKAVESFWDYIKDIICQTHRVEAKKHLFTLLNEQEDKYKRHEAYIGLVGLVNRDFKDRFTMKEVDGVREYNIPGLTFKVNINRKVDNPFDDVKIKVDNPIDDVKENGELAAEMQKASGVMHDISGKIKPETLAIFQNLIQIPKVSNPEIDDPIIGGDGDGSTARSVLLGIQCGKVNITKKGIEILSALMDAEADLLIDLRTTDDQLAMVKKIENFQSNKELQLLHDELAKELTYSNGFRPMLSIGDVSHDRLSCNKDADRLIRENLHEVGAIFIYGNHDSHLIAPRLDVCQGGMKAHDTGTAEVWLKHEKDVFVNAYYDEKNRTLYIHNGLMIGNPNEIESAFGVFKLNYQGRFKGETIDKAINDLVTFLNSEEAIENRHEPELTKFRPCDEYVAKLAARLGIRIARGHEGGMNCKNGHCINVNARNDDGQMATAAVHLGPFKPPFPPRSVGQRV